MERVQTLEISALRSAVLSLHALAHRAPTPYLCKSQGHQVAWQLEFLSVQTERRPHPSSNQWHVLGISSPSLKALYTPYPLRINKLFHRLSSESGCV